MKNGPENCEPYVIGVDVGGTKILIGKKRGDSMPFDLSRYPMHADCQQTVISSIFDAMEQYLAEFCVQQRPAAAGLGLVGHVDSENGVWKNAINISIRESVPLCAMIRERFGMPAFIDNDVHTAAKAELRYGAGLEAKDFIYINIGTGISAGIVSGGRLIAGALNYAGEIGHMASGPEGHPCKCGRLGCLEPLISGGGIILAAKRLIADYPESSLAPYCAEGTINGGVVYREAARGDALASHIAETARSAMEKTAVDLVNLLNPELLVFGGGAVEADFVLHRLKAYIYRNALPVCREALKDIRLSRLDPAMVGLIGAAGMAADAQFGGQPQL
jgi:glucokinase